jgi:hypothetical protein
VCLDHIASVLVNVNRDPDVTGCKIWQGDSKARRNALNSRHYVGDEGAEMKSFFRELKQRKVYRVALGYAVVAWLVIQIGATVMPAYYAPEWILPTFITGFDSPRLHFHW